MAAPYHQLGRRLGVGFAIKLRFDAGVRHERIFLGSHSHKAAHARLAESLLASTLVSTLGRRHIRTKQEHWSQVACEGPAKMMVYRNGDLSSAMVDIGWPHQVALPAVVSLNNGYKAVDAFCKELSLCPRRDRVVHAGQFPSAATPRNSCNGSAANGSIRSKQARAGI